MDRSLPNDIEAERATLGAILLNREAIVAVDGWLLPEHFYLEKHAWIYEAMQTCYRRRIPPDSSTVSDELRRRERLEQIGGLLYLIDLANNVPTAVHIEYYARVVERTAILRRLITAGGKIAALGFDERDDLEATLEKAEAELSAVSQRRANQDFVHIGQVVDAYFEQINYLKENRGEIVGVPTGYLDLDEVTGGLQRSDLIILAARPATGKCLPAWTLIDNPATGERVTIEEYVKQRLPLVYGLSERGELRPTVITDWVDSGVQECYRVRTRTGRTVEVTGHHPFLTVDGWVPLNELRVGDAIAVPRALPVFGNDESWPLELVRLLAYFIAEGGLTGNSPAFTNTDPIIIDDFRSIIETFFPVCRLRQERITYVVAQVKVPQPRTGGIMPPNPVTVWLKELGLMGKLAREKAFPSCIWRWSRRYLAEFLRVLMSCDGSIYQHKGGHTCIEFTVASQQLAADVYHAFVRFGLVAKYFQTSQGAWRVEMTDRASVVRFNEQIGWIGEKATRFERFVPVRGQDFADEGHVQRGHVPQGAWAIVRARAQQQGLALIELARRSGETVRVGKFAGYNSHTRRSVAQWRLAGYAEVLDDNRLRQLSSNHLYWDEIVAVEPIGAHQVYDLTVPDGANFVAQDVCVHNTSLALCLAYNVALLGHGTVGVFSLEMSRDQLVQRILAMHTGIDTQRLRTGNIRDTDLDRLMEALGQLSGVPLYIEDSAGLSIADVRAKARRLHAEAGLDLLIIDYLQLMQGRRSDNRVQEVSEISRGLKQLARELNVPLIALSQLSRAVEGRASHVPMLSDLRESGCLAGESLVYLPDTGTYERIDQLVGKKGFNVLALNTETWQLEPRQVLNAFATGRKPVFRLATRLGRSIRATANHKFLTINGWKRLDELQVGERLALPRQLPGPQNAAMSDEELAEYIQGRAANTNRDVIPREVWRTIAVPAMQEIGLTSRQMQAALGNAYCGTGLYKQNISRERAARLASVVQSSILDRLAYSDVYWDEIVAVTPDGETEVYDLTVEGLHNFVANNITCHNSIEQDADIVMFIYREELYDKETDKKGIAEIHIAKHRNGPTAVVPLRFDANTTKFQNLERYRSPEGY